METYKCNNCGMSVNASCAKCNDPLVNGYLTLDDGTKVQISNTIFLVRLDTAGTANLVNMMAIALNLLSKL